MTVFYLWKFKEINDESQLFREARGKDRKHEDTWFRSKKLTKKTGKHRESKGGGNQKWWVLVPTEGHKWKSGRNWRKHGHTLTIINVPKKLIIPYIWREGKGFFALSRVNSPPISMYLRPLRSQTLLKLIGWSPSAEDYERSRAAAEHQRAANSSEANVAYKNKLGSTKKIERKIT